MLWCKSCWGQNQGAKKKYSKPLELKHILRFETVSVVSTLLLLREKKKWLSYLRTEQRILGRNLNSGSPRKMRRLELGPETVIWTSSSSMFQCLQYFTTTYQECCQGTHKTIRLGIHAGQESGSNYSEYQGGRKEIEKYVVYTNKNMLVFN